MPDERSIVPGAVHPGFQIGTAEWDGLGPAVAVLVGCKEIVIRAQQNLDDAIVRAADLGLTTREIGLALGQSHTAVAKRLRKLTGAA